MSQKITKRDISIFFLGLFAAFFIIVLTNWKETVGVYNNKTSVEIRKVETAHIGL